MEPALPAGWMRSLRPPTIDVDGRLELRPWHAGHAPAVRAAFTCPEIQRWHVRRMDGDDEAKAWIASWAAQWADESGASWAVLDTAGSGTAGTDSSGGCEPVVLGQVGLRAVSLAEAQAHVSYWVLPTARGAGVAGRALSALTRWAFDALRLHRLVLLHSVGNQASCRVAGRAGYAAEGTMRGAGLHTDGWHDMHLHARVRTDGHPM